MMSCNPNLSTFRQGIHHIEEASSHTQVTASTAQPGIRSDVGYFGVRDEWIARKASAL